MKSKDRNTILLDFYEKYKKQPIMIEKWFQVQASAKLKNNLHNIKRLIKSPEFTYKNPNQVRSLLNVFAKNNPINFHDNSGKGYKFIADQIIILDSINPSSAASLSSAFSNWKSLDQNRKKIIKINMKRILQKKNLSPNTFEIINNINKS
jgi:aminopeptidase N